MSNPFEASAQALCDFVDRSPSPFHAVTEVLRQLEAAGFRGLREEESWAQGPGRYFVRRGGSVMAWVLEDEDPPSKGLRILGAHTDSPNLRVKPEPDGSLAGWRQLGVEVYGGVLLNSWLDRDLGLSGQVAVRGEDGESELREFRDDRPMLRVPQLAIHLDRGIREHGLQLNKQTHMKPIWGLAGTEERGGFRRYLGEQLGVEADRILAFDAMLHDVNPCVLSGRDGELVSAPRLDNLGSCLPALLAFLRRAENPGEHREIPAICFFDHEEVGSCTSRGAGSPMLRDLLERTVLMRGGDREDVHRCTSASLCLSADMAHATHPNYPDRHEADHWVVMNGGPVIKINTNARYATEAETEAAFVEACQAAEVPFQRYVNRSDLPCGSTIGPITAGNLGLRTLDVGNPQLGMHSCRELGGVQDVEWMVRAMGAFLR